MKTMKTLILTLLLALIYSVGFAQSKQNERLLLKQKLATAKADTTIQLSFVCLVNL